MFQPYSLLTRRTWGRAILPILVIGLFVGPKAGASPPRVNDVYDHGIFGPTPPPRASVAAPTLPSGFQDTSVLSGLTYPTAVRFASDGRIFVSEKSGLIKVFDSFSDQNPKRVACLRVNVNDYWDRGLLGLALD